jgi:hypothetical protein
MSTRAMNPKTNRKFSVLVSQTFCIGVVAMLLMSGIAGIVSAFAQSSLKPPAKSDEL